MLKFAERFDQVSVAPDGDIYPLPGETEQRIIFEELAKEAMEHRNKGRNVVVVQGLGFVGAAVAAVAANAHNWAKKPLFFVIGVDLPSSYWKIARINQGTNPIVSPDPEIQKLTYRAVMENRNLYGTIIPEAYSLADVIIVDVPLDVLDIKQTDPGKIKLDLGAFEQAVATVGKFMPADALVIIETTVPIGTCEKIALPILMRERARRGIKTSPFLAHSYERVMPGANYVASIKNFWRSFAGIDEASHEKAKNFLSALVNTETYPLWEFDDPIGSELAKLLENSYRAVNIAFIHEWTLLAERIGLDLFEAIESIRVRKGTHDNIRFPGFGVGGYCLTKDSLLAQWSCNEFYGNDLTLKMSLEGLKVNYKMPLHTFDLVKELAGGCLSGKNVALCGISYLPGVADTRNSPAELLADELLKAGVSLSIHDPLVRSWPERPHIPISQNFAATIKDVQGIIFAVPHEFYLKLGPELLLNHISAPPFIVDAQNVFSDSKAELLHKAGCRLLGVGKGHWRKKKYHEV